MAAVLAAVLVLVLAWPVGLLIWANGKINRVDALSGAANTAGTTWLIAGSDARSLEAQSDVTGARTDTIMLLHRPSSGPTALISIPRDSFVEIPGRGGNKINASFSWGGPQLLVETVELLSGLTVDHYVEVGFEGVEKIVDAVGGIELCSDLDIELEPHSGLSWTPGCHVVDGPTALSFSRMRYQDPLGDIGRADRQRQVIGALGGELSPGLIFNPGRTVDLASATLGAISADEDSGIIDLARLLLAFRAANGDGGVTGTPPIRSLNFRGGNNSGSSVQLDPDLSPAFWRDLADGNLSPGQVGGLPG